MRKRVYLLGIILSMLILMMMGCGKKNSTTTTSSAKDYVYKVEDFVDGSEDMINYSLLKKGEHMFLYSYNYDSAMPEEGEASEEGEEGEAPAEGEIPVDSVAASDSPYISLIPISEDGSRGEEAKIPFGQNENIGNLNLDKDGNLYATKNVYADAPDENGNSFDTYFLLKMDTNGNELSSVMLNELPAVKKIMEESGWFYVESFVVTDQNLIVTAMGNVLVFDKDCNFQKDIQIQSETESIGSIYALENGKILAVSYQEQGTSLGFLNLEKGIIENSTKIPGNSYEYSINAGDTKYDTFLISSTGVFGYNVGDTESTKLLDFVDSDLNISGLYNIYPIDETSFYAGYDDYSAQYVGSKIAKFTKVPPSEVKDKTTIVLGGSYINWNIRNQIIEFNKSNDEYRIMIKNYESEYNTESDYMAGQNRLNADLSAGKIPDILLVNDSMPIESYEAKGLFEDLYPFIDKDEEIEREDLMPNVLEAFSKDGKLYSMVPYYSISTVLAKTADVGDVDGWTIQELNQILASKPEGTAIFNVAETNRYNVLNECMNMASAQFIDFSTGKCDFNSDAFKEFLEFVKKFPEESDPAIYDDNNYWQNYESQWRDGRVLSMIYNLNSFRDYNYMKKGTFGEDITIVGYPSGNKNGSAIVPGFQLAISSKSKVKDGAWQFLRYFLSDEYQKGISYGFPLSIKRLNELGEEAQKRPTYTDENGNEVETDDYYYINDLEIIIDPMSAEEVEKLKNKLYTFNQIYHNDQELINIISEESAPFFNGQKTVDEVAAIIQSRAQVYVNENR